MLRWSINLFRIRGIQLALHGSFLLLLAYSAWEGWQDSGMQGMAWSTVILLAFFTCVVLHELGHSFAAMHFGVGVRRILLMPIGGMAEFSAIPREPGREFLITIAGPAVNFVIVGLLWLWVGLPDVWFSADYPAGLTDFLHVLLRWNLTMGIFNLAPVFPMDGGRILRAVLATWLPYLRATFWAATIGKILAAIAAVTVVWLLDAYMLGALFAFIYFAADLEYKSAQQREMQDEQWRQSWAGFGAPPLIAEPPLLSSFAEPAPPGNGPA